MFFRNGASILVYQETNDEGVVETSGMVPWFQSEKFNWVIGRLMEVDHEQAILCLAGIRKLHNVEQLSKDVELYRLQVNSTYNEHDIQQDQILENREYCAMLSKKRVSK